jgi:hypothetical protein
MKQTRSVEDSYTSIKIPESLRRQLRLLAAQRDQFIYQIIASLVVQEIERLSGNKTES